VGRASPLPRRAPWVGGGGLGGRDGGRGCGCFCGGRVGFGCWHVPFRRGVGEHPGGRGGGRGGASLHPSFGGSRLARRAPTVALRVLLGGAASCQRGGGLVWRVSPRGVCALPPRLTHPLRGLATASGLGAAGGGGVIALPGSPAGRGGFRFPSPVGGSLFPLAPPYCRAEAGGRGSG